MLITLFYLSKISIELKDSNITLTSNMPILSLPLKLRLTSKLLDTTTNSLAHFITSLHSVVRLLTLRILYLIHTNTP